MDNDDGGRSTEPAYIVSSPNKPKGSGEVKKTRIKKLVLKEYNFTLHMVVYVSDLK